MTQSLKKTFAGIFATLFLAFNVVSAQEPALQINTPANAEKSYNRVSPKVQLERDGAFGRTGVRLEKTANSKLRARTRPEVSTASRLEKSYHPASAVEVQSFGTGGGDIIELEPNGVVAQSVSLPVNVFGEISIDGDVDFFAFQGLAGQSIVIEPFATRLTNSELIADIALFNAGGQMLARDIGDGADDPLIRFTPLTDGVLIIGISDADDFGGRDYDYLLNITRGGDLNEREPNDQTAQAISFLPVTIFGDVTGRGDVDFYSFIAEAGQTLIVDVDAEVLGSRLDPIINLTDPQSGLELFFNDQYDGDDSRFNIVLPYTGRYVVGIGSFNANSRGFYRLNLSLVSKTGAPTVTNVVRVAKKLFDVEGFGFSTGAVVEVNGIKRKTTVMAPGVLRGKAKLKAGDVVTVSNAPDDRRSNPLIVQ